MTARRVLSIWLPALAIERWAKASDAAPDAPVVLTVEGPHGPIIHAVTQAAAERGARTGARLTDARALDPALIAMPADPDGDAALMQRLARWAQRWSPLVEVDGADGLRLDVGGVAHLFGGEGGLVDDVETRFAGAGLTAMTAIAPTAAAAWALSRYSSSPLGGGGRAPLGGAEGEGEGTTGAAPPLPARAARESPSPARGEGLGQRIANLPVAALRLPPEATRTLKRLGLKTIGALAGIERRSLARRFREADNPIDALDRMHGRKPEPLTAAPSNPPPRAALRLEEPATHPEAAAQALARLIPQLVRQLEARRLGARRLSLAGFRVDGSVGQTSVATAIPSREPGHLQRLLAGAMGKGAAALDPEFGFDAFTLTADWCEPLGAAQDSLVEEPDGTSDLARLVDRLSAKLGPGRVRRPAAIESHVPERASGWVAGISSPAFAGEGNRRRRWRGFVSRPKNPSTIESSFDGPPPREISGRMRPNRLLDRPQPIAVIYATPEGMPRRFVWRRAVHDIARVEGPERVAPEWWRERSTARLRDYYRVEDTDGRRYWIYREGLFGDGRGGTPEWFIHGLFG